jgi:hypothetical protein
MKSILRFGLAAVLAVTTATQVWAAAADQIFFSTSPTDPFAGSSTTVNNLNAVPLYIWVTSSDEAGTAITPADTVPGPTAPRGSAALALTLTRPTGTNVAVSGGQYYNWDGVNGSATAGFQYANGGSPISRWTEVQASPTLAAGGFTNFAANTAIQSPTGTFYPTGTVTGLSSLSVGDPLRVAATVTGGLQFAWKLGEISFTPTGAGTSTFALAAGSLQITKGGNTPPVDIDLSPIYNYGTASITVNPVLPPLTGDTDLNNTVNAQDYINVVNTLGQTGPPGGPSAGGPIGDTPPDFNGVVNAQDYINVVNNLGASQGSGSASVVPEPSSIVLLSMAGLAMIGVARKNRRSV